MCPCCYIPVQNAKSSPTYEKTSEEGTQFETFPSIKLSSTLQQCQGHKTQSLRYCHKFGMVTKGKSRTGKGSKQAADETGSLFSAFLCSGVPKTLALVEAGGRLQGNTLVFLQLFS